MLVLQSQQMVTHHSLVLLLLHNSKVVVLVLVLDQQLVLLVMDSPLSTSRGQVLALYSHQALQVLLLYSFQGGGGQAGAAGTWSASGDIGIHTTKSVGINTNSITDADLQGIGNTFQGLYIGNGMLVNDNALNGNHYIGTAFGGMMAGPVTINGVLTVDGNYVVV